MPMLSALSQIFNNEVESCRKTPGILPISSAPWVPGRTNTGRIKLLLDMLFSLHKSRENFFILVRRMRVWGKFMKPRFHFYYNQNCQSYILIVIQGCRLVEYSYSQEFGI